mmetsp:Transcript_10256/g.17658  ORF Transcript_10256/g.17658 Transcript_10256/m.17658 type:complete len:841 (-) Transcript_10256:216-2738(-)
MRKSYLTPAPLFWASKPTIFFLLRFQLVLVILHCLLQLILVIVNAGQLVLGALALACVHDNLVCLGSIRVGIRHEYLPMVEHASGERLSGGGRAQSVGETERLNDRQVRLDGVHGGAGALHLLENLSALGVEAPVDTTEGTLRGLDLHHVDRLHETGLGGEEGRVDGATASGDDLTTTAMDGVSVEDNIVHLGFHGAHVLIAQGALLGSPLEGSHARVLDLVQVLHSLTHVNEHVGPGGLGTEGPDLLGQILVPVELLRQQATADLGIVAGTHGALVDRLRETLLHGGGLHVETVVLVGRLGHDNVVGGVVDGLTERDDGLGHADLSATHEVITEILEADLKMELTGSGDNVLAGLLNGADNHRVGLGQTLETLHQLGQIGGVLGLHGHAHHGGHGELHRLDGEGVVVLLVGQGGVLQDEGVETHQSDGVAAGHVLDGVLATTHAEHGALHILDVEILLLAGHVVGAHDADLLASCHLAGEHATEGKEATLVLSGDHLGDVQHEGTLGVAAADGIGVPVVQGTLVQVLHTVRLRLGGGGQVENNHLQQSHVSGQPFLHNALHQGLSHEVLVVLVEDDLQLVAHGEQLIVVAGHGAVNHHADGLVTELNETTLAGLDAGVLLGPLLGGGVEEVVAPQLLHHLADLYTELGGVHLGEHSQGEGPVVQTSGERHGTLLGEHHDLAHELIGVCRHNDVSVLDNAGEVLECLLTIEHQLKEATVHLVHGQHGLDALGEGLTQHRLGLHAHALDAVHHHEGAVGDTERRGHLRGEVNVTGGVDQVDEVLVTVTRALVCLKRSIRHVVVQGDTSRLDGDATILLVLAGVRKTGIAGVLHRDNTSRSD